MTLDEAIHFIEQDDLCTGFLREGSRVFPEGTPLDVIRFFNYFERADLFQQLVYNGSEVAGSRGKVNTLDLQPDFGESVFVRTVSDMHGEEVDDPHYPNYLPFKNCYQIGFLGAGNHQILLDLNGTTPRLIDFFFYPCIEYDECVELGVPFTDWIGGHLSFGPDRSFYNFVRFGDETP